MDDWLGCKAFKQFAHTTNIYNISSEDNPAAKGTNQISKIKCRVLILNGENDITVPKKEVEKIKELLGDLAELKIFPETGYAFMEDNPEEFITLVTEFCTKSSK